MTKRTVLIAQAAALTAVLSSPAMAVEGGTSFYLLGSKTTMAGFLPPPGFYGLLQNYAYTGSADIDFETRGHQAVRRRRCRCLYRPSHGAVGDGELMCWAATLPSR